MFNCKILLIMNDQIDIVQITISCRQHRRIFSWIVFLVLFFYIQKCYIEICKYLQRYGGAQILPRVYSLHNLFLEEMNSFTGRSMGAKQAKQSLSIQEQRQANEYCQNLGQLYFYITHQGKAIETLKFFFKFLQKKYRQFYYQSYPLQDFLTLQRQLCARIQNAKEALTLKIYENALKSIMEIPFTYNIQAILRFVDHQIEQVQMGQKPMFRIPKKKYQPEQILKNQSLKEINPLNPFTALALHEERYNLACKISKLSSINAIKSEDFYYNGQGPILGRVILDKLKSIQDKETLDCVKEKIKYLQQCDSITLRISIFYLTKEIEKATAKRKIETERQEKNQARKNEGRNQSRRRKI